MRATFTEYTEGKPFYPMAGRRGPDLAAAGYEKSEWEMHGQAVSYDAADVPEDGRVTLTEADSASYATRVLVRRPSPEAFSGVLLIEWLNVSGGQDAAPEYTYVVDEILRRGHAWIGVSAQYIGVEGGDAAVGLGGQTAGLRNQKPERYGRLHHPGDAYSYDILTQLAEYARGPGTGGPLGDLRPDTVIAMGESQSAFALTSYLNGVHPLTRAFDGYLLHSRGAGYLPYDDRGRGSDISASLFNGPVRLRDDQPVPAMLLQAEGDLTFPMSFAPARQPDHEHLVTWEIAGSAHADAFQLGEFAPFVDCDGPINNGQQAFVLRAALRHLVEWVGGGSRPPSASPIRMDDGEIVVDDWGHALGGVRTPAVDAPVERLVGAPLPEAQPICMLLGRTVEVSPAELEARWTSSAEYLEAYREATDRLIAEGYLLAEDREAVLADARAERLTR